MPRLASVNQSPLQSSLENTTHRQGGYGEVIVRVLCRSNYILCWHQTKRITWHCHCAYGYTIVLAANTGQVVSLLPCSPFSSSPLCKSTSVFHHSSGCPRCNRECLQFMSISFVLALARRFCDLRMNYVQLARGPRDYFWSKATTPCLFDFIPNPRRAAEA